MFSHSVIVLFLTALQSANALTRSYGCGKSLPCGIAKGGTGLSNTVSITSGGISRSFLLHVPTNYDSNDARGLIFSFAGRGQTALSQELLSSFSDPYFNPDMLAVYPMGIDNQWQGDPAATTDDITFTLDMIDHISRSFCVNTDAVYATGKSNGGGFIANILACNEIASAKIAAFASCSGAYYQSNDASGNCEPDTVPIPCSPTTSRLTPMLEFHGDADTTIPFNGGERRGECLPSVNHFVHRWAELDGLDPTSNVTTELYDGHVHQRQYGAAVGKLGLVTNYEVEGLTHAWASTLPNSDSSTPTYFNATSIIMDFFITHPLK